MSDYIRIFRHGEDYEIFSGSNGFGHTYLTRRPERVKVVVERLLGELK